MSSSPSESNSYKTFSVSPSSSLSSSTTYKIRVTTGVKDFSGNTLSSQYETSTGFTTGLSYVGAWVKSSDSRIALDWKSDSFIYMCLVSTYTYATHGSYGGSNSRLTWWDGTYNTLSSSGSNILLNSATYVPATLTSACNPFWTNSTSENTYYTNAARSIGWWNFTFTIISTFHEYPLMSVISTRRTSENNYYTYGTDEYGNEVLGSYEPSSWGSTGYHEILTTGSIIDQYQVFTISSSNNTSSGCYFQYTHSSSSWSSCFTSTGAKLYGTPRTYRTNIEQTSDEMMEKRVKEQIIDESMRSNRTLSDKDLKAFNRYQKLLQILNSTDKEPLRKYLRSFRTK
jgi:hypothetical protein